MFRRPSCIGFFSVSVLLAGCLMPARAQNADIRVSKDGGYKKIGILVSAAGSSSKAAVIRAIVLEDLKRSGWFLPAGQGRATFDVSLNVSGAANNLTVAAIVRRDGGARALSSHSFNGTESNIRLLAHKVSDAVVMAIMKRPGIATSRILMVGERSGRKDLYVCDYDGQGLQQLTREGVPCHSPAWGASPSEVYYTSPHAGFPDIYSINLGTRSRSRVAKYPGLNAGAALSPDGRSLAMILSRDGNPELYVRDVSSKRLQRLTRTRHASEASPSWSPDGKSLVYVSDSTGAPQIYTVSRNGGRAKRLSYGGSENVSPDWGPDGSIVYSSRQNRRYQLVMIDPYTGKDLPPLTSAAADHEEPSWAPDGRHIVYVRTVGYRESLYILDTLGDPEVALTTFAGDWHSPAWSQFK